MKRNRAEVKLLFYGFVSLVFVLAIVPDYHYLPEPLKVHDKINHFIGFFALFLSFDYAYRNLKLFKKGIILLCYGLFIEIVQLLLPYRDFSLLDFLADGIGIASYMILIYSVPAILR